MPTPKPKVYIANKAAHDFSDAERFGTLVYVTRGEQSKFALGKMARAWARALEGSSENDFFLTTSLTTLCSIGAGLFARKHGRLNMLVYRNGRYLCRTLLLDQILACCNETESDEEGGE